MAGKYTITTLNCKGLRQSAKRRCMFQFLKTKQSDIFLLQETHVVENDVHLWEQEWNAGTFCHNAGTNTSAGQLILTIKPMNILVNTIHEPGRLHEVILEDQDYLIRIFNVYGYNSELLKLPFIAKLQNAIQVKSHILFTWMAFCNFAINGSFNSSEL